MIPTSIPQLAQSQPRLPEASHDLPNSRNRSPHFARVALLSLTVSLTLPSAGHAYIACDLPDVEAIRTTAISQLPADLTEYREWRAALGRWYRLLQNQGYNLDALQSDVIKIYKVDDGNKASSVTTQQRTDLQNAFITMNSIQNGLTTPPTYRQGPADTATNSATNKPMWRMYLGDGSNQGSSNAAGPNTGRVVWKFAKNTAWNAAPVVSGGKLYLASPGIDVMAYCLDPAKTPGQAGFVVWKGTQSGFDTYSDPGSLWEPFTYGTRLLYRVRGGSDIMMLESSDGTAAAVGSASSARRAYIIPTGDQAGTLKALDPNTGAFTWNVDIGGLPAGDPTLDGTLAYSLTTEGVLKKHDLLAETSSTLANLSATNREFFGEMTLANGHLFFGDSAGNLYAVNVANGTVGSVAYTPGTPVTWRQYFSPPAYNSTSNRVYVGTADGKLLCLDFNASSSTLTKAWSYTLVNGTTRPKCWIRSRPCNISDMVYVASLEGDMIKVQDQGGANKSELGSQSINKHGFTAELVAYNNTIYAAGRDLILYAVSSTNSLATNWKFGFDEGVFFTNYQYKETIAGTTTTQTLAEKFVDTSSNDGLMTSPTIDSSGTDGIMYIGGSDGFVNAVNITTGGEIWKSEIRGKLAAAPVIAGNRLIVGQADNPEKMLFALNRSDGSLNWKQQYDNLWVSPVYDSTANKLWFGGRYSGIIYCINANGTLVWSHATSTENTGTVNKQNIVGIPSMDANNVYFGAYNSYYYKYPKSATSGAAFSWAKKYGITDSGATMINTTDNSLYVRGVALDGNSGFRSLYRLDSSGNILDGWTAGDDATSAGTDKTFNVTTTHYFGAPYIVTSIRYGKTQLPIKSTLVFLNEDLTDPTGTAAMPTNLAGGGLTPPVICTGGSPDRLVTGSTSNPYIYCYSLENAGGYSKGDLIFKTYIGGVMLENAPSVYANKVIVQCQGGYVYCIE